MEKHQAILNGKDFELIVIDSSHKTEFNAIFTLLVKCYMVVYSKQ